MTGHFIVFDGMDGAGKSTAMARVAEQLRSAGHQVVQTREPGGSRLAEDIRTCMLQDREKPMPKETELLLVFAARAAHMQQTVMPALATGKIVLCDRFVDSSHIYQGLLGGCDTDWIDDLTRRCVPRGPDLTVLFDLPVSLAQRRIKQRGASNRFDRADIANLERIRAGFAARAAKDPARYFIIDAGLTPPQVADQIMREIESVLR